MDIIEVLKVLVFGIVEGFTEWLPISSTGHMILLEEIIPLGLLQQNLKKCSGSSFRLGAILAVLVLYFHKLNPFSPAKDVKQKKATLYLWLMIPGSLPSGSSLWAFV